MTQLLLAIIYLTFISLGLPDSLLGSAWPTMYIQFGVPISYAGIISMIIAGGTIISSLQSDRLTKWLQRRWLCWDSLLHILSGHYACGQFPMGLEQEV